MANKIPTQVLQFAKTEANLAPYKMFADYYAHYQTEKNGKKGLSFQKEVVLPDGQVSAISLDEKEEKMSIALRKEIARVSGVANIDEFAPEAYFDHPTLKWATFAVISAMIDMVLPDSIIESTGIYSDVRTIGWGDSAAFDVMPRDLFVVSKVGRNKRVTELKKQYRGQVTVIPEPRAMTVFASLPKILAGKESLGDFVAKMTKSFEVALANDIYDAFYAAMDALDNTASTGLRVAGYSQTEFVRLSQTVAAWNGGAKPIAIGTQLALANILPANANYRYEFDSEYVTVGYLRNFQGTDIMVLPQVADWTTPFGLKLSNNRIWFVVPSVDKIVKVVLEGNVLSYNSGQYDYANLNQTATLVKSWGTAIATKAVAATMTV